jgi:hypothetical protein
MKKFLPCCAGIDIGKQEMTATILTGWPDVEPMQQTQTFGTTGAGTEPLPGVAASQSVLHARGREYGKLLDPGLERTQRTARRDRG